MSKRILPLVVLSFLISPFVAGAATLPAVGEKVYVLVGHPANVSLLAVVQHVGMDFGADTSIEVRFCDGLKYRFEHATGAIDGTVYSPSALAPADQSLSCKLVN